MKLLREYTLKVRLGLATEAVSFEELSDDDAVKTACAAVVAIALQRRRWWKRNIALTGPDGVIDPRTMMSIFLAKD